ncbi:hypothetical protein ACPA0F_18390 [Solibacillus silvestris]
MPINIENIEDPKNQALVADLLEVEQRRQNGEDVGITNSIQRLAEKHEVKISKARNWYYTKVKGTFENVEDSSLSDYEKQYREYQSLGNLTEGESTGASEEQIAATLTSDDEKLANSLKTPELRPTKPPYKPGEILEVSVEKVIDNLGAICVTTDGYAYQGLVHISRIIDKFVSDVHDYFEEGQVISVRFIRTNQRNELELSTVNVKQKNDKVLGLRERQQEQPSNPPINTLAEQLEQVKHQIAVTPDNSSEIAVLRKISNEEEKIIKYLNGIVGTVTPAAREELFNVIEEHGIFAWTLKMTDVSQDFTNDLGLLFVNMVKAKLEEDGL